MKIKRLIIILLGFLLLLEIFLRLYKIESLNYFRNVKIIHKYNQNYFVGLRPNTTVYIKHFTGKWEGKFTINSLGMRNIEEPDRKHKKIICLGDSLVMGYGVSDEDTFCYILNQRFKQTGYQFLNAGIDGLGSLGAYQRLKEVLGYVKNVESVLFFISPNDFTMPEIFIKRGILPDDVIEKKRLEDPLKRYIDSFQFILTDWSYSFFILKITIKQLLLKYAIFKNEIKNNLDKIKNQTLKEYIVNSFLLPERKISCPKPEEKKLIYKTIGYTYITYEKQKLSRPISCPEPVPENIKNECTNFPKTIPDLPDFTKNVYKNMIDLSKQKQFRLIIVILPMQIEEIYCNNIKKFHPLRMYALQAKHFFKKNNIEVWDLMEFTHTLCKQNEYGIRDHYIPEDGHLTKLGNLWVAEHLSHLLNRHLVK